MVKSLNDLKKRALLFSFHHLSYPYVILPWKDTPKFDNKKTGKITSNRSEAILDYMLFIRSYIKKRRGIEGKGN